MTGATSLDHVGIAGPDLEALAATYTALGFTLTPFARHSGRRTPGGPVEQYGSGNRCAMLRRGYLELISVVDPSGWSLGLDAFLARRSGLFIVALAMTDPEAELARLRRGGLDLPEVAHLERPVDDADPDGMQARFSLLALPEAPEGRLQLIRHETPEALWQPRFLDHPNHVVALEGLIVAAAESAETAARFSRLTGRPVIPDPEGGFRLDLPQGQVRMLPDSILTRVLPGVTAPETPFLAGIVLRTDDGNAAVGTLLRARSLAHAAVTDGLLVAPAAAGGAALLFAGDASARTAPT